MHFTKLKELPAAIRYLKQEGWEVKKQKSYLNGRSCYRVKNDNRSLLLNDYGVLECANGAR